MCYRLKYPKNPINTVRTEKYFPFIHHQTKIYSFICIKRNIRWMDETSLLKTNWLLIISLNNYKPNPIKYLNRLFLFVSILNGNFNRVIFRLIKWFTFSRLQVKFKFIYHLFWWRAWMGMGLSSCSWRSIWDSFKFLGGFFILYLYRMLVFEMLSHARFHVKARFMMF